MRTILIQPEAVILRDRVAVGAAVLAKDGLIVEVTAPGKAPQATPDQTVTLKGSLLPGLLDLQVNGAGGRSVDETSAEALGTTAQAVWSGGATAFLPTLITAPFDELLEQTRQVADWIDSQGDSPPPESAAPTGIHLEGPFLENPGAHDPKLFVDPTPERVRALIEAAKGHLRLVTLAPCRAGAAAATAQLVAAGAAVSIGHVKSTAGFDACVDAGATVATHLFNAMSSAHHRDPGIVGRVLDEARLSPSIILDGVHVHPAMVRNAWRCLGADRFVLVSDCMAAMGMPDGEYQLSTIRAVLKDGVVRDSEGRLAGSALSMADAARCFLETVPGVGAWSLSRVAAGNPCRLIGLGDRGSIAVGQRAEFALLESDHWLRALRF